MALIAFPIIPETAGKIWKMLGYHSELSEQNWSEVASSSVPVGQQFPEPIILFQKIEDEQIEQEIAKLKKMSDGKQQEKKTMSSELNPLKTGIDIDDVQKLDLRVGVVLKAEAVPKSKKLLKLEVDIGLEKRTIVAGIGQFYPQGESLIGKKVIVVANLKPATLMGIESQGMVLAGSLGDSLEVVSVADLAPGSIVK